jgi:hypothetical protein
MMPRRLTPSLTQLLGAVLPLLAAALLAPFASAATITGTVSDRTTNKVAANDAVVLIGFGQGMQEVARTTTDAHGHYSIEAPDEGTHLIRVDHQKATYFQPVPPGAHTVDVDVYDVAEKVKGISTEADVLSMQTDPGGLHVVENYFVRNDSKPAMTQLSRRAYEIYLPAGVKIEASAAMGPAGMPVASSPIPVGEPGLYAFVFPIRPGETRFQVSYHLPYSGSLALSERVALPTENLVVILPKSMQFTPKGTDFQPVPDSVASQTFVRKGVAVGQPVEFTVAGTGSMPREAQGAQTGPEGQTAGAGQAGAAAGQGGSTAAQPDAGADNRPGGGLGPPIDTPDPLHKYKWWILSGLALVLVVAAAWLLRKPSVGAGQAAERPEPLRQGKQAAAALQPALRAEPGAGYPVGAAAAGTDASFLGALKDALFALETERLSGRTSEEDYRQLKASLEVVLRQALERETAKR